MAAVTRTDAALGVENWQTVSISKMDFIYQWVGYTDLKALQKILVRLTVTK